MAVTAILFLGVGRANAQQNSVLDGIRARNQAESQAQEIQQRRLEAEGLAPGQESADPGASSDDPPGFLSGSDETLAETGREADDKGPILNLFDDPEIKRLLGDNPRFVYNASERPDPMIFPPVRNAAIFAELAAEAEQLVRDQKLTEALEVYETILGLDDRRYFMEARRKINELRNQIGLEAVDLPAAVDIVAELPAWVPSNTRGVLYDENFQICLVGDFLLKPGDPIPTYPEITVESISASMVVYRISNQTFEVPVTGYEEFGAAGNLTPILVTRGQ